MSAAVRKETAADLPAILDVNRLAFGGIEESELVDRLRTDDDVVVSLVATFEGKVAGHILFSNLHIQASQGSVRGAALAPLAVRPELQRRGIGSALVWAGLEACRESGIDMIVVLGHPAYYPRFGFSAQTAQTLKAPFSGDDFMALELTGDILKGEGAVVTYPPAFGLL